MIKKLIYTLSNAQDFDLKVVEIRDSGMVKRPYEVTMSPNVCYFSPAYFKTINSAKQAVSKYLRSKKSPKLKWIKFKQEGKTC